MPNSQIAARRTTGLENFNLITAGIDNVATKRFVLRGDGQATFGGGGGLNVLSGGASIGKGHVKIGDTVAIGKGLNVTDGGLHVLGGGASIYSTFMNV